MLVVSPDRFTRGLTRIFVVTPNVRDGLHCDFLRAAMTDVLGEQHDKQPDDGDRGTETVLEVWIPDLDSGTPACVVPRLRPNRCHSD